MAEVQGNWKLIRDPNEFHLFMIQIKQEVLGMGGLVRETEDDFPNEYPCLIGLQWARTQAGVLVVPAFVYIADAKQLIEAEVPAFSKRN